MIGVITSDCAVPYLDASVYTIILYSFFFPETALSDWTHILHIKELTLQDKLFDSKY